MNKLLVIADDFTGANDTGVQLAKKGAKVEVSLKPTNASRSHNIDVLVINTETRAQTISKAKAILTDVLSVHTAQLIYKKIDSTLRGNVGIEIETALKISGAQLALLAPAIPSASRVTRNGICYVNNVPLIETEFANDPKTPIVSSHIDEVLQQQTDLPVYTVSLNQIRNNELINELEQFAKKGQGIVVLDSENDSDLSIIGQALLKLSFKYMLAGAAGLANALPDILFQNTDRRFPVLAVAGSLSEATQAQINFAQRELPLAIVDIYVEELLKSSGKEAMENYVKQAVTALQSHQHCILRTSRGKNERQAIDTLCEQFGMNRKELGEQLSVYVGVIVQKILSRSRIGGLFLTGGDMAIAVAEALGAEGYRIHSEVVPCIPCGTFINSEIDDLPVITKAGGFGSETALRDVLYFVEEMYSGK